VLDHDVRRRSWNRKSNNPKNYPPLPFSSFHLFLGFSRLRTTKCLILLPNLLVRSLSLSPSLRLSILTTWSGSAANATTVAPPFDVYNDSLSKRASDAVAAGHVPSNDPNRGTSFPLSIIRREFELIWDRRERVEARPDGEKQDVRKPEEMTEADRTRLDPLSHRPEGGEWEKE